MKTPSFFYPLALLSAFALILTPGAYAQSDSVTNSTAAMVDGSIDTRGFDFSTSSLPPTNVITKVDLFLTFSKNPEAAGENPFYDEMEFVLTDPSGMRRAILIALGSFENGEVDASFSGTIAFDDSAGDPVNVDPNQPQAGTFRPIDPLSIFNGTPFVAGTWTLSIEDRSPGAPLTFTSGTLTINTAIPEPATSAALLLGAAFFGGGALLRRRRSRPTNSKI